MNDEDIKLLKDAGWSLDCYLPFEISHSDGSTATGQGANSVLAELREDHEPRLPRITGLVIIGNTTEDNEEGFLEQTSIIFRNEELNKALAFLKKERKQQGHVCHRLHAILDV